MSTVQSEIEKQFQFDVKEHAGELLLGFNNARIERRLCDFVIKVGSKEMHVHKIVLSECSPYFRGMFSNKMREKASGFVEIKGVDPECMEICILYFYTGKASMFGSKLQQLLQAADMLQIPRLCEAIGSFLLTNLDPDSFFLTRKVANTFNLPALKEHCDKYAMEKFTSIAVKPDFKELEKEYVSFLIGSKENKASDAVKCKALILWTSFDQENRFKTFEESFQTLQLEQMPANYRLYLSQQEPLVADSNKCLRYLFKSHQTVIGATGMNDFTLPQGLQAPENQHNNAIAVFDKKSKSIQAFHPENKTWTRLHGVTDKIIGKDLCAVAFDKTVYVLARDKTNYKLNYSDPNASWTRLPDRQVTDKVLAVILKGDLYALNDAGSGNLAIEKLDSSTTTWSRVADKHTDCCYSAIVATGDFLYSLGGINTKYKNDAVRFDPIVRTWHRLPVMPTARFGAAAVELAGKIYVIGGFNRHYLKTVECFDIQSAMWTTVRPTNCHHYIFNACVFNGKIYAVGGEQSQNSIEEYDEISNSWNTVDKMHGKEIKDQATFPLHG